MKMWITRNYRQRAGGDGLQTKYMAPQQQINTVICIYGYLAHMVGLH